MHDVVIMEEKLIVGEGIDDLDEMRVVKEGISLIWTLTKDNGIFSWIVLSHLMEQIL